MSSNAVNIDRLTVAHIHTKVYTSMARSTSYQHHLWCGK